MKIFFPWPPKELSPNSRAHWAVKSRVRKKYKSDCFYWARCHPVPDIKGYSTFPLRIVFHPPSARRADLDNMLSSIKSTIDSCALAWGVDDSIFTLQIEKAAPVKGGSVVIITPDG